MMDKMTNAEILASVKRAQDYHRHADGCRAERGEPPIPLPEGDRLAWLLAERLEAAEAAIAAEKREKLEWMSRTAKTLVEVASLKSQLATTGMSEDQIREAIKNAVEVSGGLRRLARAWKMSPSYLSEICNGRKHAPAMVARHFGLTPRTVVRYEPDPEADFPRADKSCVE